MNYLISFLAAKNFSPPTIIADTVYTLPSVLRIRIKRNDKTFFFGSISKRYGSGSGSDFGSGSYFHHEKIVMKTVLFPLFTFYF
jgi:hypothetical protein